MATKWAICGSGNIAHDFCTCLKALPEDEHQIVAVASSSSKIRAEGFAERFGIPHNYGSYDEMLNGEDFDVVYIGTINPYHVETCLKFINAGKAVLCEKPMALTMEGCQKVLAAAKEKEVLFVEGYWSRFFPGYTFIRNQVESGVLGDIKLLEASLCIPLSGVPNVCEKHLGGGGLMAIGCYPVQIANFVFREVPEKIWSDGVVDKESGVDKGAVIFLRYSGGRMAALTYSTETQAVSNSLLIRGTKGTVEIPDCFWSPNKIRLNGVDNEFPLPKLQKKVNFEHSEGLTYEAQGVRHCLVNGLIESPAIPHKDSLNIMTILQKVLVYLGIKYDAM